jgi:AcrR family transcriptional regulator
MPARQQAPTGLARRARRLSDQETGDRMLAAARQMVNRDGLTVSLEHIGFEDVIRDADVSRSSAYRRWPHKDLFLSDLVRELAADPMPAIVTDELNLIRQIAAERLGWLDAPELRQALIMELFRQLPALDFRSLYESRDWRTYLALHATFLSLADGELRDQVRAALAASERERIARVARAWERMTGLFGFRLRPELGSSFEALATILSGCLRGLVVLALSTPDIAEHTTRARPPGAAEPAEWTLAALGMASIASAFLEPDPQVTWDARRVNALRDALAEPGAHP